MSAYVERSIAARNDLCKLSTKTMDVIEKLDSKCVKIAHDVDKSVNQLRGKRSISKKMKTSLTAMHVAAEMLSERKSQVAVRNYDLINQHICMIDQEIRVLEKAMLMNGDEKLVSILGPQVPKSFTGRKRNRYEPEDELHETFTIDPNEPVYCLCRQIAFGDMIACDNEECAIEWFHYTCVNLNKKPRSTWLCPDCSRKRKQSR